MSLVGEIFNLGNYEGIINWISESLSFVDMNVTDPITALLQKVGVPESFFGFLALIYKFIVDILPLFILIIPTLLEIIIFLLINLPIILIMIEAGICIISFENYKNQIYSESFGMKVRRNPFQLYQIYFQLNYHFIRVMGTLIKDFIKFVLSKIPVINIK